MDQARELRNLNKMHYSPGKLSITAVTGGKGGVGKSNVSLNLSIALAKSGKKVLLLDADFGLANLDILIGIKPRFNISHLLNGEATLEEIAVKGPSGITLIPSASGLTSLADLSVTDLENIFRNASNFGKEYDHLIIDTPAGISRNVLTFLLAAHRFIVVATPEPTSLTDSYALIKSNHLEKGEAEISVLMNMCSSIKEGQVIGNRLKGICKHFLGISPDITGVIPYETAVKQSIKRQIPVVNNAPDSTFAKIIKEISEKLSTGNNDSADLGDFFSKIKELMV